MGFLDFFRKGKVGKTTKWSEFGGYSARFVSFGSDPYSSDVVRSCVRPLADFTSKAYARCKDPQMERVLNYRPNLYMTGKDFLYKVRTMYEIRNSCFIYIQRDDKNAVTGLYPIPYQSFEAVEYNGRLYITFTFANSTVQPFTVAWDDLAVIRKDYYMSDIAGASNDAILDMLELIKTTNAGVANAVKSTANLRGIIKNTKAMLVNSDLKQQRDDFVRDYLNAANEGGVAALDATMEFTPISMSPIVATAEQLKEFREDVYRYYGVNDDIVMGRMSGEALEAFYVQKIEPFLVALSTELTSKIFQGKAIAYAQNFIVYEANRLQFASLDKKIQVFTQVVLYGGMTINEWRQACNLAPIEGGDEMIRRLDAAPVDVTESDTEEGEEDGSEE